MPIRFTLRLWLLIVAVLGGLFLASPAHATTCFALATSSSPAGAGIITAEPPPDCNGGTQYTDGTIVTLTAIPNSGYAFRLWSGDASASQNPLPLNMNGNRTIVAVFAPIVPNDDISGATPVPTLPANLNENTFYATKAFDDPDFPCAYGGPRPGSASVWFQFTAPENGVFVASTVGSQYDTVIALWTGTRGALTAVGCDEDSGGDLTSILSAPVTQGQTYILEVADWRYPLAASKPDAKPSNLPGSPSYGGALVLSMQLAHVANDDFDAATPVDALPATISQDTSFATSAADDPSFTCPSAGARPGFASVWFKFSATENGVLRVDTSGSGYDTILGVWKGTRGNLEQVACDDDNGDGVTSLVDASVEAGVTYYVEVAGYYGGGALAVAMDFHLVPEVPTLLTPVNGGTCRTKCLLDWEDVPATTLYHIRVKEAGKKGAVILRTSGTPSTVRTPKLVKGKTYRWRVNACIQSECSAWTAWWSFTAQ